MQAHNHLLPQGSTLLEKRAAEVMQQAVNNPIIIADLINPDRCPVNLLPYLAWAFSVDNWNEDWTEQVKRNVIKSAFLVHKQKGTITALKTVIEPIGYLTELKEWHTQTPEGQPGTFSLVIEIPEIGIDEKTNQELNRLINEVKPISRHLTELALIISPIGQVFAGLGQQLGEITTIYSE